MARPHTTPADRSRGALLGLAAGWRQARGPRRAGDGDAALALLLAEELLEPQVDLRRLAERWIAWGRRDGGGLSVRTTDALEHLARYDAPAPADGVQPEAGPIVRCLPIGIAAAGAPRSLTSGTYHTVCLTHPDPITAWCAVAVNVALAQFVQGRRDFVPDVVEVLTANDAPADLLAVIRRLPFVGREDLFPERAAHGPAVTCVELALWAAHHEPVVTRGIEWVRAAAGDPAANLAVAASLLGAREGEQAVPPAWTADLDRERIRGLGRRLVRE